MGVSSPSIDELLDELNAIERRLEGLPDDAYDERLELADRRRELKILAHDLVAEQRTTEHVRRELADLNRVREEIVDRRLSVGHIGGGGGPGGGGIEIQFVNEFNRILGEGWGLREIEDRIRRLELELREVEELG